MTDLPDPELLLTLPEGFELWRIAPVLLKDQELNARAMKASAFQQLTNNVKRRGALESMPFVQRQETQFFIISGHHRVRAALAAGLPTIVVLADPNIVTRSQVVAKQLAHNAIQGEDDNDIVKRLLADIADADDLLESFIGPLLLEANIALQDAPIPALSVDYDWRQVTLAFLPSGMRKFDQMVEAIGTPEMVAVADREMFDAFRTTMRRLGRTENIKAAGALLWRMMEITQTYLDALEKAAKAKQADEPTE